MNPEQYFKINDLWDIARLRQHAEHHSVYIIESLQFPNIIMLHYKDEVQYNNSWSTFSRMARGLILDMKNQKVLAHPFDKFFNLGQMPETSYDSLKELGTFQTSEKLDGSMIIMFRDPNTNKLTFTTKGSLNSEHGQYANSLQLPTGFWLIAQKYAKSGTLVFELITKRFQIVIDYPKKGYVEGLYLIGYRDNISNKLASQAEVDNIADCLGVPTFKTYSFNSLDQLIDTAKDLPVLEEGFVLRFPGDLLVKVKGNAYLKMHRFISHLSDKNLLLAVSDGTAEGLVELCPDEFRDEVVGKIQYFKKRSRELQDLCYTYFNAAPKGTRKEFALWTNKNVDHYLRGFLFTLIDNKPLDVKHLYKVVGEIEKVSGVTKI